MTLSPTMRLFLAALALASGGVAGWRLVESFEHEELYKKDFVQEYVLAKAVVGGGDPYQPMPLMVARWISPDIVVNWEHPTPHTPVTAVLSVPLVAVDYPIAAGIWLALELGLLILIWSLIFRWWGEPISWPVRAVLVLLSLSLGPVIQELWFGNLSLVLLATLMGAWLALREDRDVAGGLWLGLAIAVKLAAWPVVLLLVAKRRWRAIVAAGAVVVGLHLLAVAALGYHHVADYYLRVGPDIARGYRQHDGNYSLWTVSGRLFAERFESVVNNFVAYAPWPSATLDGWLKAAIPVAGLLVGLILAIRCVDFDCQFGIVLCTSLVVNPVAWDHSLLIAAIPIVVVLRRLSWANFPRAETTIAVVCFAITMFPQRAYLKGAASLFGTYRDERWFVPFAAGLVTYLPLVALAGWVWLLCRFDDRRPVGRVSDPAEGERR